MAIAVRRAYACPTCRESFAKWGLCQAHVCASAPCREALGEHLRDTDALQELCRAAAVPGPAASGGDPATPSGGGAASGTSRDAAVAQGRDVQAPGERLQAPAAVDDGPPKRLAIAVVKRLDHAVQTGHLTEADRHDLDSKLEDLAEHPLAMQVAAVDKFFAPGLGDLRWIADKGNWLLRCVRFCVRTNLAAQAEGATTPSTALLSALAMHALLPDALTQKCWDMYLALQPELQRHVVAAVRTSILSNVVGKVSDHFLNLVCNEQVVYELGAGAVPRVDGWPEQLEWDAIEGSLYHRVLQHMLFKQRNSEERLLRELAEADPGVAPGAPGSLLHLHASTAAARQQGSADVLSVLHAAASSGLARVCARLIAEGLDVDERAGCQETTPLHLAAAHGEVEVLRLLLAQRADPNARDAEGHSALYGAVVAAAQLREGREEAATYHNLQLKACSLLLLAGADNAPEGNLADGSVPRSADELAEECELFDLRNLIRLHMRFRGLKQRFDIDESAVVELSRLQYETAMFVITLFERHVSVTLEAAPTEFRAILSSEYIQERDAVRRLGNRLARRLLLSKKVIDALCELPPQAGIAALKTWKIEEIIPDVYEVPDHLNAPAPEPAPVLPDVSVAAPHHGTSDTSTAGADALPAGGNDRTEGSSDKSKLQGKVRKWDSERGFGFIVQDLVDGEDVKDIFVHRKNVVGSTPARHLDLREGARISYKLGEQDGRPRALEATMLDADGKVLAIHLTKVAEADSERLPCREEEEEEDDGEGEEGDLSRKLMRHLRSREVQEVAKEKGTKVASWLRCVGLRRHNTGRRDDAIWKREIERRVDIFLERNTTPLQKRDFDFRVRRFLHEFSVHNTVTRVSEALAMVEASTAGKSREDVRSWPAYVATLLRNFDPKLHDILADRDRRSRLDTPRAEGGFGAGGGRSI